MREKAYPKPEQVTSADGDCRGGTGVRDTPVLSWSNG